MGWAGRPVELPPLLHTSQNTFTAKRLHIKAQGKRSAALGWWFAEAGRTLQGFHKDSYNPFRVARGYSNRNPGMRSAAPPLR